MSSVDLHSAPAASVAAPPASPASHLPPGVRLPNEIESKVLAKGNDICHNIDANTPEGAKAAAQHLLDAGVKPLDAEVRKALAACGYDLKGLGAIKDRGMQAEIVKEMRTQMGKAQKHEQAKTDAGAILNHLLLEGTEPPKEILTRLSENLLVSGMSLNEFKESLTKPRTEEGKEASPLMQEDYAHAVCQKVQDLRTEELDQTAYTEMKPLFDELSNPDQPDREAMKSELVAKMNEKGVSLEDFDAMLAKAEQPPLDKEMRSDLQGHIEAHADAVEARGAVERYQDPEKLGKLTRLVDDAIESETDAGKAEATKSLAKYMNKDNLSLKELAQITEKLDFDLTTLKGPLQTEMRDQLLSDQTNVAIGAAAKGFSEVANPAEPNAHKTELAALLIKSKIKPDNLNKMLEKMGFSDDPNAPAATKLSDAHIDALKIEIDNQKATKTAQRNTRIGQVLVITAAVVAVVAFAALSLALIAGGAALMGTPGAAPLGIALIGAGCVALFGGLSAIPVAWMFVHEKKKAEEAQLMDERSRGQGGLQNIPGRAPPPATAENLREQDSKYQKALTEYQTHMNEHGDSQSAISNIFKATALDENKKTIDLAKRRLDQLTQPGAASSPDGDAEITNLRAALTKYNTERAALQGAASPAAAGSPARPAVNPFAHLDEETLTQRILSQAALIETAVKKEPQDEEDLAALRAVYGNLSSALKDLRNKPNPPV